MGKTKGKTPSGPTVKLDQVHYILGLSLFPGVTSQQQNKSIIRMYLLGA